MTLRFLFAGILFPSVVFAQGSSLTVTPTIFQTSSIPRGAQRVEVARYTFTASCAADVQVSKLTLHHSGLSETNDILRLYAADDRARISRTASFSSNNQTAVLRMRALLIPKCEERTIHILADFSQDAAIGAEHIISIENTTDLTSDAATVTLEDAEHQAPVRSTAGSSGSIELEYLSQLEPVRFGTQRTISRFRLSADEVSDHVISAITFTNDGKARNDDLENLSIFHSNGTQASGLLTQLDDDSARFTFDPPLLLRKNQTRVFSIRADITGSSRQTIRLILEEPSDLEATTKRPRSMDVQ